jgi:hypothetical protein
MARRARTTDSLVTRVGRRLTKDGDGLLALLVAAAVGVLAVLDVLGTDQLNAAILLVLALLAATLLRDRQSAKEMAAEGAAVRQVDAYAAAQERLNACLRTQSWEFRGGIGDVLRAVTLPTCVEASADSSLSVRLEILDPDDKALCEAYAKHRALLVAGAEKDRWTAERTREEVLATIFAACWYRKQHRSLDIRVGLSSVLNTICWDRADDRLIITEDGKPGYALVIDQDKPYYGAFSSEMASSFRRTRELPIAKTEALQLPPRLRGAHVQAVFETLGLDVARYDERALVEIGRMALKDNETALSALRARTTRRSDPDPVLAIRQ